MTPFCRANYLKVVLLALLSTSHAGATGSLPIQSNCKAKIVQTSASVDDVIAESQKTLAEWLAKTKEPLVSRKEREKHDTLFLIHKGIPSSLKAISPKDLTFRHYFKSKEQMDAFLKDPKLIAGTTPYKKLPLDSMSRRFQSDTYEDVKGVFLTKPGKDARIVGADSGTYWVDVKIDERIGLAVLPSDDYEMSTYIIPGNPGFSVPVLEVVDHSQ